MKVLPSVLFLAAVNGQMGEGYIQSDGSMPIEDVHRRLKNLGEWGQECAANLTPPAKNNILSKLHNFNRQAVKYYNRHNADFTDLDEPMSWADLLQLPLSDDRTISTDNPCQCLWRVGRGYSNFYLRGFNDEGKIHKQTKKLWNKMNLRLEKSYGCDMSAMGYKDPVPETTTPEPPTQPPNPYPTEPPCDPEVCSEDCPCAEGSMCNYDGETSGFCESCDNFKTGQECYDTGFTTATGIKECMDVCVKQPCDPEVCSKFCPCAEGSMCNYDNETSGFCESCDGFDTEKACYDAGFITETGTKECMDVCIKQDPCEDNCSADCPCAEGSMCNFDDETSGFCESCEGFETGQACYDTGFISETGIKECLDVCVKPSCPDGWTKFDDEDRCFKTKCQKKPMSFDAANGQCNRWGSLMTMIKSEVQNGQVADSGPVGGLTNEGVQLAGGIWINGHDHDEGTWTYTDGSAMSYTNWAQGQPNDGNPNIAQDCLWMNFLTKGEWDDMNCVNVRSVHCVSCSKGME